MTVMARELLDVLFATIWQGASIALTVAGLLALSGCRLNAATRYIALQGTVGVIALVPLVTTLPNIAGHASLYHVFAASTETHGAALTGETWMPPRRLDVALSDRAVLLLVAIWTLGVLAFALRIGAGSLRLARVVRGSSLLAIRDGIRILVSPDIDIPIALGLGTPSIVVPASLAARAGEEFECIVLHELAHIRRGDAYMNACNRVMQAFLYFNPAVVLLLRAVSFEREVACDDWAVARSRDLGTYTKSLASVALRASKASFLGASTALGFGRSTVARIKRLEDERRNGAIHLAYFSLGGFTLVFFIFAVTLRMCLPAIAFASQAPLSNAVVASTACPSSEVRFVNGPAPQMLGHVPNGLKTLVRVRVSQSGTALDATLLKTSGNVSFDRAVIDAAKKGVYAPQMRDCRRFAGQYIFEATTS